MTPSASIAARHGFPPDVASIDAATSLVSRLIAHPGFFSAVAECDGRIVGSSFLDERSTIAGVGHVTVAPEVQDRRIGRELMLTVSTLRAAEGGGCALVAGRLSLPLDEPVRQLTLTA